MDNLSCKIVVNDCELKGAFEVRKQVFVEEQGIPEDLELDEYDMEAMHMVAKDGERIVGTARVLFLAASQAKLERMAILKPFRHRGIGKGIISFLDEEFKNRGIEQVVLHAQCSAVNFYKSCGFEESGSPFWEAGIKHVKMQKRL
jgi:predicted GNAT family N-acyltransferase